MVQSGPELPYGFVNLRLKKILFFLGHHVFWMIFSGIPHLTIFYTIMLILYMAYFIVFGGIWLFQCAHQIVVYGSMNLIFLLGVGTNSKHGKN